MRPWNFTDEQCRACSLNLGQRNRVPGCGACPADLLLVGEAPGQSETLVGRPFIGPSGALQAKAIRAACRILQSRTPRIFLTNLVACQPPSNRDPSPEEIWRCWGHVEYWYRVCKPVLVVAVGRLAQKQCVHAWPNVTLSTVHPAFILRKGGPASELWMPYVRRWVEIIEHMHELKGRNHEDRSQRKQTFVIPKL